MNNQELKNVIDDIWGMTPREILQKAGTDAMRNIFGENIWVTTLKKRLEKRNNHSTCISDVRFLSEINLSQRHKKSFRACLNLYQK